MDIKFIWKPIGTAPKTENKPLLVLRRGIVLQASCFEGRFYPDIEENSIDWEDGIEDATHWMDLPEPPKY